MNVVKTVCEGCGLVIDEDRLDRGRVVSTARTRTTIVTGEPRTPN